MPGWEYRIEQIELVPDIDPDADPIRSLAGPHHWAIGNGGASAIRGWDGIAQAITALGAQGWELVQVVTLRIDDRGKARLLQAWFKRPVAAPD